MSTVVRKSNLFGNDGSKRVAPTMIIIIAVVLMAAVGVMIYMLFGLDKSQIVGAAQGEGSSLWGDASLGISSKADESLQGYQNIIFFGIDVERMDKVEEAKGIEVDYSVDEYIDEYENEAFGKNDVDPNDDLECDSDAMVVLSRNKETKEVKIFSIFRDTYVEMDADGGRGPMRRTFAVFDKIRDGMYNNISAINRNLDLNIKEAVVFDWWSVRTLLDGIGGLDVDVDEDSLAFINEYVNEKYIIHKKPGYMHLNAHQLEFYLRYLRTASRADVKRNEHIIEIFQLVVEKAQQMDQEKMLKLWDEVYNQIRTNMAKDTITEFITQSDKVEISDAQIFPFEYKEWQGMSDSVYVVPFSLKDNIKTLYSQYFGQDDYEPSTTVKNISAKIEQASGFYK